MISVVCIMNDEQVFKVNLLRTLNVQDTMYELIVVDNRNNKFTSISTALNYGGNKASGNYIMFIHQDVCLVGSSWLRRVEEVLDRLSNLGIAGVAGVTETGKYMGFIHDRGELWGSPIKNPVPVQTLDEQLVIIPRDVFKALKFDERFRCHSYSADYCLAVKEHGLRAYVVPAPVKHNSLTVISLKAGSLLEDDLKLLRKHGRNNRFIYKTTGCLSIKALKRNSFLQALEKPLTTIFTKSLWKEIPSSNSLKEIIRSAFHVALARSLYVIVQSSRLILDAGTVPLEQLRLKSVKHKSYSVGISNDTAHIVVSKKLGVHDDFVLGRIDCMPFRDRCFDLAIVVGILEYLPKAEAIEYLRATERVCKKIVLLVPNNCSPKSNAYRTFISRWTVQTLKKLKYQAYGLNFAKLGRLGIVAEIIASFILPSTKMHGLSLLSSELLAVKNNV